MYRVISSWFLILPFILQLSSLCLLWFFSLFSLGYAVRSFCVIKCCACSLWYINIWTRPTLVNSGCCHCVMESSNLKDPSSEDWSQWPHLPTVWFGSVRAMWCSTNTLPLQQVRAGQSGRTSFSSSSLSCRDSGKSDDPSDNNATAPGCSSVLHQTESAWIQQSYFYLHSAKARPCCLSPQQLTQYPSNYYELTLCKQEQSFFSMCPLYLAEICAPLIQLIWKSETQKASVLL